jgi:hypothetical protein
MDILALRERLHEYIETADERHLSAIYVLVEDANLEKNGAIYDEDTMNMLYQRRENHRNGISKSYSAKESMDIVRQHKK